MTEYILSIDPGVSTGIALIGYEPDEAPTLVDAWQFTGGVASLRDWISTRQVEPFVGLKFDPEYIWIDCEEVVSEKFTPRRNDTFGYTTESLEPLRGEGLLIALGLMPDYTPKEKRWRAPALQYLVGGKDLADKKKRQHAFLRDIGFYRTNKDFPDSPSKDGADDFRSAAAHGLNYLAREVKHEPTFRLMTEWSEQ